MEIIKLSLGQLGTNTYLVIDDTRHICVIIDPGAESEKITDKVKGLNLSVKGILVTHGHFDHIGAADQLKTSFQVPVYAHEYEADMMRNSQKNLSAYFIHKSIIGQADRYLKDQEILDFGGDLTFNCIEVPGHTAHSLCFYFPQNKIVFTGDTLFSGSIGRTDLYEGPPDTLVKSIQSRLLGLPTDTQVYPGHGDQTTIGIEKATNPYLLG